MFIDKGSNFAKSLYKYHIPFVFEVIHHIWIETRVFSGSKWHNKEHIFLFVCCKEGSFFSVDMVNWNLMTSLFCIQVDDPNFIWPGANGAYRIITIWNRELIFFDNTINFYIRNIYYLYETINVWNMSLMRFYGQDNAATPGFSTFFYP